LAATAPQPTTKPEIKILYSESDDTVLSSQTAQIRKAGYQVATALNRAQVQDALQKGAFDLVILGSTLSKDDRHHLPYMVKKAHPGTRVLVMHAGTHHHEVDATVDSGMSMLRVLEKIATLLQPAAAN
jgi:DNA-binding NtrC family response regulator